MLKRFSNVKKVNDEVMKIFCIRKVSVRHYGYSRAYIFLAVDRDKVKHWIETLQGEYTCRHQREPVKK